MAGSPSGIPEANGRITRHLRGHLGSIHCIAWRRDGLRLASASADGTAIETLERARSLATTTEIHQAIRADLQLYRAGKPLRDDSW